MLKCDGYDDCVLGMMYRFGQEEPVLAYDKDRMIAKLAQEMTLEEAEEFFSFNIIGAWVGDGTPCFVSRQDWAWFEEDAEDV